MYYVANYAILSAVKALPRNDHFLNMAIIILGTITFSLFHSIHLLKLGQMLWLISSVIQVGQDVQRDKLCHLILF